MNKYHTIEQIIFKSIPFARIPMTDTIKDEPFYGILSKLLQNGWKRDRYLWDGRISTAILERSI